VIESFVRVSSFFEPTMAALLVQTSSKFTSRIYLVLEEKTANAKSIMGVISLGLMDGQTVKIMADGEDEQQAVSTLEHFLRAAGTA
jgi:phosphotransferase system HPr (HPr) family protein